MKKTGLLFLAAALILSMTACGRRNNNLPTETTTNPTEHETAPATTPMIPEMDPTLETNIPDPNVDTSIPDMEDTTRETTHQSATDDTVDTHDSAGDSSRRARSHTATR